MNNPSMIGLTDKQKKQLDWVDKWDFVYINSYRAHLVSCKDCNVHQVFSVPDSVRIFITRFHRGHNTNYVARKGL